MNDLKCPQCDAVYTVQLRFAPQRAIIRCDCGEAILPDDLVMALLKEKP